MHHTVVKIKTFLTPPDLERVIHTWPTLVKMTCYHDIMINCYINDASHYLQRNKYKSGENESVMINEAPGACLVLIVLMPKVTLVVFEYS